VNAMTLPCRVFGSGFRPSLSSLSHSVSLCMCVIVLEPLCWSHEDNESLTGIEQHKGTSSSSCLYKFLLLGYDGILQCL
jgi:hypothetical protein